jgi:hypothetical protein
MWIAPDYIHPGDAGAALIASCAFSAWQSVPTTSNLDFVAAMSQRPVQSRGDAVPRPLDGGLWQPKGTTVVGGTWGASTVFAMRFVPLTEWFVITEIGVQVTSAGTGSQLYVAIAEDVSYGSYPGTIISDFGLATVGMNATGTVGVSGYALLPPGNYWILVAQNAATTAAQAYCLEGRTDETNIWLPNGSSLSTADTGIYAYHGTVSGISGSTITNIEPTSWGALQEATASKAPRPWVSGYVQKYASLG